MVIFTSQNSDYRKQVFVRKVFGIPMEVTDDYAMCGLLLLQGKCQAGSFDLHGWIWRQHT